METTNIPELTPDQKRADALFDALHEVRALLSRGEHQSAYQAASHAMNDELQQRVGPSVVIRDMLDERVRQFVKWGNQNHDVATWMTILGEEFGESCEEALNVKFSGSPVSGNFRTEMVQVASVAMQIVEWIDRKIPESDG